MICLTLKLTHPFKLLTYKIINQIVPDNPLYQELNVSLMLVHRLQLWLNIKSTLGEQLVFAG